MHIYTHIHACINNMCMVYFGTYFKSYMLSSRFFSTCVQAPNRRCFHHVISCQLYFLRGGSQHRWHGFHPSQQNFYGGGGIWNQQVERLTGHRAAENGELLMQSSFVQTPRKSRTFRLIPQISGGQAALVWLCWTSCTCINVGTGSQAL